ncbi:MAG: nitroreductase family protein [Thermoplasmatota archaeon]
MIIMPLGHPAEPYEFSYDPITSALPVPANTSTSLSAAIGERSEAIAWQGTLSRREQTQLVWSSYGASYYIDEVNDVRHRTVPSSHGTYPLRVICCNATSVFEYLPGEHALATRIGEDRREAVAAASRSFVSSAPMVVVPVLNTSMVDMRYPWPWHYEAAAAGYTALLEATAWNLSGNLIAAVDGEALRSALSLGEAYLPLYVVPVGRAAHAPDVEPPSVSITRPESGYLYLYGRQVMPVQDTIVVGSMHAEAAASDDYEVQAIRFFADGAAIGYSHNASASAPLPMSGLPARHEVTAVAYDYAGNAAQASLSYLKIL